MQTSYSDNPSVGRAGLAGDAFSPRVVLSKICRGLVQAGRAVFRVPGGTSGTNMLDPGEVYQQPDPGAAADVDAIIATGASTAGSQLFDGADLDGVVGGDTMYPARKLTLVLSSHADWDATTAVWRGYNELGQLVTENVSIPNGGNATVTTTGYFRQVVSLTIPAQSGTGGTFTAGIAILDSSVTLADMVGVAMYEPVKVCADADADAEFGDADAVSCMKRGPIWVITEDAVSEGDDVYVRVGSGAGGSDLGTFRNDSDSASCVQVTGAVFTRDASAGIALVHFL